MNIATSSIRLTLVAATMLSTAVGCTDLSLGSESSELTGATVETNKATYTVGEPISVHYAGLPGNQYDWVALSADPSADSSYLVWYYVGPSTDGDVSFPSLSAGSYEARAYENDSFTVLARQQFTVQPNGALQVTTDNSSYTTSDTVLVSFTNGPSNQYDWVAIANPTAADSSFVAWYYTGGASSVAFTGLPAGTFEARLFENDSFNKLGASASFTVTGTTGGTLNISTSVATYMSGDTVTVNWSNGPGNQYDWIAISQRGSSQYAYLAWTYINGQKSGTEAFAGLADGQYEARFYENDSFNLLSTYNFVISGPPAVSTDTTTYAAGAPITVKFANLPAATPYDWIAISTAGSPPTSYIAWSYANGVSTGEQVFGGLPAGDYEARVYENDSFNQLASSTFTVTP